MHCLCMLQPSYKCVVILGDSDIQCDEIFLNDLKATYKICATQSDGSVTVNNLASKYLETHSNEEYKRNLKGKKLKMYLDQSNHFTVTQNTVTIIEGKIRNYACV